MASFSFFNHVPTGSHGATVTSTYAETLWYVIAALILMWMLMFLLPKPAKST
ncbi:hypothetical protein [Streptomyces sp. SYP-A7185]|uniref:hypothetical protein n=1 Tax=Streptomyces sp. SYP-A7185 TaxID=3040076 RepID=UPI0038F7059A